MVQKERSRNKRCTCLLVQSQQPSIGMRTITMSMWRGNDHDVLFFDYSCCKRENLHLYSNMNLFSLF